MKSRRFYCIRAYAAVCRARMQRKCAVERPGGLSPHSVDAAYLHTPPPKFSPIACATFASTAFRPLPFSFFFSNEKVSAYKKTYAARRRRLTALESTKRGYAGHMQRYAAYAGPMVGGEPVSSLYLHPVGGRERAQGGGFIL